MINREAEYPFVYHFSVTIRFFVSFIGLLYLPNCMNFLNSNTKFDYLLAQLFFCLLLAQFCSSLSLYVQTIINFMESKLFSGCFFFMSFMQSSLLFAVIRMYFRTMSTMEKRVSLVTEEYLQGTVRPKLGYEPLSPLHEGQRSRDMSISLSSSSTSRTLISW